MNTKLLEIILLVVGAMLLAVYVAARAHGEGGRLDALAEFDALRIEQAAAQPRSTLPVAPPDRSEWSARRVAAHEAASEPPLAVLRIAGVDLEVPVFGDTTEPNLNRGAGWIEGTAQPGGDGNVGIAAHRDGYFRALRDVAVGDELEVETLHGSRRYRITGTSIVEPTDVSSLYPTAEPAITLVTCYPFYFVGNAPQRFVVRAIAIN